MFRCVPLCIDISKTVRPMALEGTRKTKWQKVYMRLWRRADTLARHRAIAKFPPLKTMTQLDLLIDQGLLRTWRSTFGGSESASSRRPISRRATRHRHAPTWGASGDTEPSGPRVRLRDAGNYGDRVIGPCTDALLVNSKKPQLVGSDIRQPPNCSNQVADAKIAAGPGWKGAVPAAR